MERVWSGPGREIWLARANGREFESPFEGEDFAMLVMVVRDVEPDTRNALCNAFVAEGVRYAACWGEHCDVWHDTIDEAYLVTCPGFEPQDDTFVMTSGHARDDVDEAVWFLLHGTRFGDVRFAGYLILVVGEDGGVLERARGAVSRLLSN